MTNLSRMVRRTSKAASSVGATVIDVSGETASVRLSSSGALMRNLKVMGGPVSVGQEVEISFFSSPPVIVAYSAQGITAKETNQLVDTSRTTFIMSPEKPLAIYHNGVFVANASALNFVDGA